MSNDVSTQLPNPPKLQPMSSLRAKVWRSASLLLTIGGLALIGAGGWMFMQQQIEAGKPPPRLVEVSASDLEPTASPTLEPSTTSIAPTVTQQASITINESTVDASPAVAGTPASVKTTPKPATATPLPAPTDTPEIISDARPTGDTASNIVEDDTLSLADNPLPVVEDEPNSLTGDAQLDNETAEVSALTSTGSGLPLTRIVAESIDLDSSVVEVGWEQVVQNGVAANVWTVADYAAGWHRNSTLPGQGGNIVLSAHHNIKGEVFRYTVDLEPGDTVTLYDETQRYDYVVEDKFIVKDKGEPEAVRRENAKWIGPFNEERLTLVTCWPYNNNTHRLIVIAKPVEKS